MLIFSCPKVTLGGSISINGSSRNEAYETRMAGPNGVEGFGGSLRHGNGRRWIAERDQHFVFSSLPPLV